MQRVVPYAEANGFRRYNPSGWDPFDPKGNLRRNLRWIRGVKVRNEPIKDIGNDPAQAKTTPSKNWQMEQQETADYPNLQLDAQPGANGEPVVCGEGDIQVDIPIEFDPIL